MGPEGPLFTWEGLEIEGINPEEIFLEGPEEILLENPEFLTGEFEKGLLPPRLSWFLPNFLF